MMKKVYKSKIGLELVIPLVLIFAVVLPLTAINSPQWIGSAIPLLIIGFIIYMFATTDYTIEGNSLKIRCGFFYKKEVDIRTIKKITETRDPISAPATSLDRLELFCNRFESILISPKLKTEFIKHIQAVNPNIELALKAR